MKKVLISVAVVNIIMVSNVEASVKEMINSAMFWKSEHLENIDFASIIEQTEISIKVERTFKNLKDVFPNEKN
ncbi:hypothetical protein [Aliarcobacter lanthieri]|uniref:hypothetical protein n=1 Tax=Aliarcobacter lanthieri TaxID=1355374 RepID=UPI003AAC570B